jgi:hypothetical protein
VKKKILIFTLTIALFSLKTSFNQQVHKLSIKQPPPLTIIISEAINATVDEIVNLDAWFHVEEDISCNWELKFRDGSLFHTIDNPLFTITRSGDSYLTEITKNEYFIDMLLIID